MESIRQRVLRLCSPVLPPDRLAWLRILIGGFALAYLIDEHGTMIGVARSAPVQFQPVGLAALLDGPVSVDGFEAILNLTCLMGVLFVVGFRFAYSGPIFALLFLAVTSYRNSWSMIFHSENLLSLHLVVLGVTPAAQVLSLDGWIRARTPSRFWNHGTWSGLGSGADWRFGWPCILISGLTAAAYWVAGMAKILGPLGWSWATGENLLTYIARDALRKELLADGAPSAVWWIQAHPGLLTAVAVLTLVLELGAPLFLVHRVGFRIWALGVWMMHWGILAIMGIEFPYQLSGIAFLSSLPLEVLSRCRELLPSFFGIVGYRRPRLSRGLVSRTAHWVSDCPNDVLRENTAGVSPASLSRCGMPHRASTRPPTRSLHESPLS